MPPKANPDKASGVKTVPADCASVLMMALNVTSITNAQYDMMSALDGTRTASSFQHQFRSITQKAKELKARVEAGETFDPVLPSKKRGPGGVTETPPSTPKKVKRTPKAKATPKSGTGKKMGEKKFLEDETGSEDSFDSFNADDKDNKDKIKKELNVLQLDEELDGIFDEESDEGLDQTLDQVLVKIDHDTFI